MRKSLWKYVGRVSAGGVPQEFIFGVPARDLIAADVDSLSDAEYAAVEASALYETAQAAKPIVKPTEVNRGN